MNIGNIIGGILLVSCTTIGAGILALPTSTASSGFIPTTFVFGVCWFFMTIGALLLLEVNLWIKGETNLISMANKTIGYWGKAIAWIAYLMLLYALICAYLTASGAWLIKIANEKTSLNLASSFGSPIVAFIMAVITYLGTYYTDRFNRILAVGLFIFFITLIGVGFPHINYEILTESSNFKATLPTIPLIITTFGFAIIVPSLCFYLKNEVKPLVNVIIIGSIIPLIFYILWEMVTLGTLSIPGEYGLVELAKQQADGTQVAVALENVIGNPIVTNAVRFFAIFAVLTSLIGVTLSLLHFLADGLKIKKQGLGGLWLALLTFVPPLLAISIRKNGFNEILSFGGLFVALILGLLPVLMTWHGRYKNNLAKDAKFRVFGGKPLLIISGMFFVYVILQELIS